MAFPDSVVPRLLEGRLALITGGGQRNGRTLALGLAQAGARVIATDMNGSTVDETARLERQEDGDAWSFALDVTSAAACEAPDRRAGEPEALGVTNDVRDPVMEEI
jgi:NAD(P)-dependent dehydrogenase (short-subunit alcohol dehydrogenase family)